VVDEKGVHVNSEPATLTASSPAAPSAGTK